MKEIENSDLNDIEIVRKSAFDAGVMAGELNMLRGIHQASGSHTMLRLIEVEEKKLWRGMGYKSFADYLNSDRVPFGSTTYYKLLPIYKHERDTIFDLMTGHKIPRAARLMLAQNNVQIELAEDEIVINDQRAPIADKEAVLQLVNAVKNALAIRDRHDEENKNRTKKLETELEESKRANALLRNGQTIGLTTNQPYFDGLINIVGAYNQMFEVINALPPEQKLQFKDSFFEGIAAQNQRLRDAFHVEGLPEKKIEITGESLDEYMDSFFDQVNLDEVDSNYSSIRPDENDEELAASL